MRFGLVYKKNGKYKESYSIIRNNIEEASKSFKKNLPDDKEYFIKVIRPCTEYYDLDGNKVDL